MKKGSPLWQTYKPTTILNTTKKISCKAWNSPVEYHSRESKHGIKESENIMLNPIFKENGQGQKHPA